VVTVLTLAESLVPYSNDCGHVNDASIFMARSLYEYGKFFVLGAPVLFFDLGNKDPGD